MTVDVEAFTVDDVWRVDDVAMAGTQGRAAQEALSAILERIEVPVSWEPEGRLTFYPHDAQDVATIRRAEAAAREIQARLRQTGLSRQA